jgi:hypothetical protein
MALTLIESAKIALGRDEMLKATVMELFAKGSDILQYMPFDDITGNALKFDREKNLPGVAFRGVNEAYTESTGEVEKVIESLAIAGGDLDVDAFLIKTGGAGQRAVQEGLKIKALSLNLTKTFIKGDVTSDPKAFDGLQVRCTGDQLVSTGTASSSAAALTLTKIDELIDAVEDPTHFIMNKTMRRRMSAAARLSTVGGYVTYDLDAFGRRVTKFNDIPILVVDKDETNTDIIDFLETSPGGVASTCSSLYCVSFAENGVMGLQSSEMDVRDLGEQDSKPVFRTRIEWYITLAILRPRAAARLFGVVDAAIAA